MEYGINEILTDDTMIAGMKWGDIRTSILSGDSELTSKVRLRAYK